MRYRGDWESETDEFGSKQGSLKAPLSFLSNRNYCAALGAGTCASVAGGTTLGGVSVAGGAAFGSAA